MTFSEALNEMNKGKKVTRTNWNGKNQYIFRLTFVTGQDLEGNEYISHDAIAFKGTTTFQIGWLASQADMLSNDWEVLS